MLLSEIISRILTVINNEEIDRDMLEKIERQVALKQMIVLARPGEVYYAVQPNAMPYLRMFTVLGMTIDDEGTWYTCRDQFGYNWNLDTVKFLDYMRKDRETAANDQKERLKEMTGSELYYFYKSLEDDKHSDEREQTQQFIEGLEQFEKYMREKERIG